MGHSADAARWTFFFLGGDSYPADAGIEARMRGLLAGRADRFIGQRALLEQGAWPCPAGARVARLRRALAECGEAAERIVVIGRSSGARVATLLAAEPGGPHRLGGLVCLAYPFRAPGRPVEPERFRHLSALRVPTWILQGRRDPYGGIEAAGRYPLSAAVRLRFVEADHSLDLPPRAWAEAGREIAAFLGRA